MKNLKLHQAIVFFDLETTGLNVAEDQICQFSFVKIKHDGETKKYTKLVKPSIPIPQVVTDIHGITNEMVENEKPFSYYAAPILKSIKDCILAGYNIRSFDVPLLAAEFERNGLKEHGLYDMPMIDAKPLYRLYRPATLIAAVMDLCGRDMEDAHDAEVDTMGTVDVVDQLASIWEITDPNELVAKSTPEGLVDFAGKLSLDADNDVCYAFGKHKGKKVKAVNVNEPDYAQWIINSDFPQQTKDILKKEIKS